MADAQQAMLDARHAALNDIAVKNNIQVTSKTIDENGVVAYSGPTPPIKGVVTSSAAPKTAGLDTQQAVNAANAGAAKGTAAAVPAMQKFITAIRSDRGRFNKPFLYEVLIYNQLESGLVEKMSMYCHTASVPGYTVETHHGRIYGLDYEIPVNIKQDDVQFVFYADVNYQIPNVFLNTLRQDAPEGRGMSLFDASYSPRYKDDVALNIVINILNEQFDAVSTYVLGGCFFKEVQHVSLNAADINRVQDIAVVLSYEKMAVFTEFGVSATGGAKADMADTTAGGGAAGKQSSSTGEKKMNVFSSKISSFIGSVKAPFQGASASIAAVRDKFNSLGIQDALAQVASARKAILDPLHQLNESRLTLTSTVAQINSTISATTLEINQGKAIMSSFDRLF